MRKTLLLSFLTVLILLKGISMPLCAQSVDAQFNPVLTTYGGASVVEKLSTNKIMLCGDFHYINGTKSGNLVLLNPDGTLDESFAAPEIAGGSIQDIVELPDGNIVLAGSFTSVNGKELKYLAKIKPDGSLDETFKSSGPNNIVFKAEYQALTEKIIVYGFFGSYHKNTQSRYLVRIDQQGNLDETFSAQVLISEWGTGLHSQAGLAVMENGNILYSNIGGKKLVRLLPDGQVDDSFSVGSGLDDISSEIVPFSDGSVALAGNFKEYNGASVTSIIKLKENGALDNSFVAPTYYPSFRMPRFSDGALTADNKLVFAGNATNSATGGRGVVLFRLNADGSYDNTFSALSHSVGSLADVEIFEDGSYITVGAFGQINGDHAVLKLKEDGTKEDTFTKNTYERTALVTESVTDADGKLLIAGGFNFVNHTRISSIARIHPDGTLDSSFSSPLSDDKPISSKILLGPAGEIYLGAKFFYIKDGTQRYSVIRLKPDGTMDTGFTASPDVYGNITHPFFVNSLALLKDKIVLGGGEPFSYNSGEAKIIDGSGQLITALNKDGKFGFTVTQVGVQNNSFIIVAGGVMNSTGKMLRFTEAGDPDPTFQAGMELRYYEKIIIQDDGKIIVGGNSQKGAVIRFDVDGAVDPSFSFQNSGSHTVYDILPYSDNKFLMAGNAGVSAHNLDGSLDPQFKIASNSNVLGLAGNGTSIFAAGQFTKIGNERSEGFAKIRLDPPSTLTPAEFTATALAGGAVKLEWKNETGQHIKLERSQKPEGPFTDLGTLPAADSVFTDKFTVSSTLYYYRASYTNFLGQGPPTPLQEITSAANSLQKPVSIQGELTHFVNVQLSWEGSFYRVKRFQVEAYTDTLRQPVKLYTTKFYEPKTEMLIEGLKENTHYFFRVRADYGSEEISDPSGWLAVKTEQIPFYTPYNLQGVPETYNKMVLSWEDSSAATKSYKILRSAKYKGTSSGEAVIATISGNERSFTDETVETGFTYRYRVEAINLFGTSLYSPTLETTIPSYSFNTSTEKAALATARSEAVGFSVLSKGYVGLGFNGSRLADLWEYTPSTDSWEAKAAFPTGARSNAVAFVIGDKAFVGLGRSDAGTAKDFYKYEPGTNTWTKLADFPNDNAGNEGLADGVSFVLNGVGYVSLGTRNGVVNRDLYAFDPSTGQWAKKASFPGSATTGAVSWTNDGLGYVAFGGVMSLSDEVWKYDPINDSWTKLSVPRDKPSVRTQAVAFTGGGRAILATGNVSENIFSPQYTQEVFYYTTTFNSWSSSGYTSVFNGPARASAVGFKIGNNIYIATGNGAAGYLADLWVLEPGLKLAPGKVEDLAFKALTSTTGMLKWRLPQDNEEGVRIEMAASANGPYEQVAVVAPGVEEYLLENLTEATPYFVRVSSFNADASSAYTYAEIKVVFPPQAPGGPTAALTESNQVSLSWTDQSEDETGFEIWRKESSAADSLLLISLPANAGKYTDEAVKENTAYTYYVVAVNEGGASPAGQGASLTTGYYTPASPTDFIVVGAAGNSITLTWKNPGKYVETEVWFKTSTSSEYRYTTIDKYSNRITLNNLSFEAEYSLKVRAKNHTAYSEFSEELRQRTAPSAPALSSVLYTEMGKVSLHWQDNSETEEGYIVRYHKGDENWITLDTLAANEEAYIHAITEKRVSFHYTVLAFNSAGNSESSSSQEIYIYDALPDAPFNMSLEKNQENYFAKWQLKKPEETLGTLLEYKIKGQEYQLLDTIAAVDSSMSFSLPAKTDTLWVRAMAYNVEGNSVFSEEVFLKVTSLPAAPEKLMIDWAGSKQIELTWEDAADNEEGYIIEFHGGDGVFEVADTLPANTSKYIFASPVVKGTFTFRVAAFNIAGSALSSGEGTMYVLGTDDELLAGYRLYPNPTEGRLTVEGDFRELRIYNNQGQLLKQLFFRENSLEKKSLDLGGYPAGMYHLEMYSNRGVSRKTVLKISQ